MPTDKVPFSFTNIHHVTVLLLYLAMKMIKMILSLILVLIYCLAVREEARAFLLTFISFYLIYLIFETWFFFSFDTSLPSYLLPAGAMESPSYVPPFSSRREERNVCQPEVLL